MANVSASIVMTLTKAGGAVVPLFSAADTIDAFIETKDLDFGSPFNKFLEAIICSIDNYSTVGSLELVIKHRKNRSQALTALAPIKVVDQDPIFLTQLVPQSRFFRLRFQDTQLVKPFKLSKIEVFGKIGSKRL